MSHVLVTFGPLWHGGLVIEGKLIRFTIDIGFFLGARTSFHLISELLPTMESDPSLMPDFRQFADALILVVTSIHFHKLLHFRFDIFIVVVFILVVVRVHFLACPMRIIPYKFLWLIKLFRFRKLLWMRDRLKG